MLKPTDYKHADLNSRGEFMWRVRHYLAILSKGSDGKLVTLAVLVATLSSVLLLVSFLYQPMVFIATAFAILALLGIQTLSIIQTSRLRGKMNDIHCAVSLENGLQRAGYTLKDYFYDGAAGTPSLQLQLLKVLSYQQPKNILELGSGQTSRVLSAYAKSKSDSQVITLEQNAWWVEKFSPEIVHSRHQYLHTQLVTREITIKSTGMKLSCTGYEIPDQVQKIKFDFILVDGPDDGLPGTVFSPYARAGILWYTPQLLADKFIVIFDDAESYKYQMTIEAFKQELSSHGLPFASFRISGVKDQEIVCSPDWKFLRSV
jgi:hypothetical protein